jgi:hypothetical protein
MSMLRDEDIDPWTWDGIEEATTEHAIGMTLADRTLDPRSIEDRDLRRAWAALQSAYDRFMFALGRAGGVGEDDDE